MPAFEKFIYRLTVIVGVSTLCFMMLQIVIDVVMRTWFGSGFPATAELVSRYYMVLVSFLPIAYTEVRRRHVEATIFTDMLPLPARRFFLFLGFIFGLIIYLLLTWGTIQEALNHSAQHSYVEAGTMDFLTWPSYWILPFAFSLMSVVLFMRVISMIKGTFVESGKEVLVQDNKSEAQA